MKRVTRMLQMDKLLPRLRPCIRMTFSAHPHRPPVRFPDSSSSYSSAAWSESSNHSVNYQVISTKSLNLFPTNDYNSAHFPSLKNNYSAHWKPPMEKEKYSKVVLGVMLCMLCVGVAVGEDGRTDEQAIKDQQREGYAKSSCDYDPSNRTFDEILPHLLNIYGSRGTAKDFEIYAPDATFEDPLMRAEGLKQIKSAFYSIPKVFSESRIVEYSIKENTISPGNKEILMDNKQYYKFMGRDIHMISLIKLQLTDGKIVRHEDLWDKKPLKNRETVQLPLVGRILELTRRGSMLATHVLMGFGKDPTASK